MAAYDFTYFVSYTPSQSVFNSGAPVTGTISDNEGDNLFEVGEDHFEVPSPDPIVFQGTVELNGKNWPVFTNSGGYYIIYATEDIPAAQVTTTLPTINSTSFLTCFTAGTLIETPTGPVPVEDLSSGQSVITKDGQYVRVKWIGRQTVSTRFGPAERRMPVRFAAGSLGDGLPHTDLTVTADHGMLVDGVICHAGALVNGTTISRVPLSEMGETYTVYHIETDAHEIILANGAPAETFIDNVSRRVFDNFAEFEALYGDVPEMEELPYPRAMSARQVPTSVSLQLAKNKSA